jgi:brefeldin A-inhibited guanine nucleotide-exchange protein
MGFDEAVRLYLCDSNFRLPGEAQKIDRLLEAFCLCYVRDNPGVFRNHSSAFILCFALIMLNTDAHNPGIERRRKMTQVQFRSNLRGVDDGHDFPEGVLNLMYKNITENPIQFLARPIDGTKPAASDADEAITEKTAEARAKECHKALQLLVRKAHARLRRTNCQTHTCATTTSIKIANVMFDMSWFKIIAAIKACAEKTTVNARLLVRPLCAPYTPHASSTVPVVLIPSLSPH